MAASIALRPISDTVVVFTHPGKAFFYPLFDLSISTLFLAMLSRPQYPQEFGNVDRPIFGCLPTFCAQFLVEDRSISGCLKTFKTILISQCRSLFVLII